MHVFIIVPFFRKLFNCKEKCKLKKELITCLDRFGSPRFKITKKELTNESFDE